MDCPCWNTSRSQQARKDIARSRRRSSRVGKGVELRNLIVVKPAVGFTLPSAGLSPAPSDKMRGFVPGRTFFVWILSAANLYLARYFTGEEAGGRSRR